MQAASILNNSSEAKNTTSKMESIPGMVEIRTDMAPGMVLVVSAVPITLPLPTALTLCSLAPKGSFTVTSVALHLTRGLDRGTSAVGLWQEATAVIFSCSRWSK